MRILVTGGSGKVGHGVVAHLIRHGHEVRVVDRKIDQPLDGAVYTAADTTDYAALREQVRGVEGIVHLAAYPNPMGTPGPEIFRVNCLGTYNVFEAAAEEKIARVVCASSINALGFNFGVKSFPIQYFPVDEGHPTFTTDPYSFSKQTTESIADYYWRRDGISSACIRMPFVYARENEPDFWTQMIQEKYPQALQTLLGMQEDQRIELVNRMKAGMEYGRARRLWEKPPEQFDPGDWEGPDPEENPAMAAFFGYTDFWSVISVEDTAQAFEKALLAEYEGSQAFFISERYNTTGVGSETLLKIFYPEVTERKRPIQGAETLLSYDKARQMIGYEPEYLIRDRLGE